jgi:hypothetical protein
MSESDNPSGVWLTRATPENQQETVLRDPQRPYASHLASRRDEEMVRTLRRRRETGRNDRSANPEWLVGNRPSEIPCRVSNDLPHEGVIPRANPANNGEPLPRSHEREIPWEVEGLDGLSDPVTTEAKAKMVFLPSGKSTKTIRRRLSAAFFGPLPSLSEVRCEKKRRRGEGIVCAPSNRGST